MPARDVALALVGAVLDEHRALTDALDDVRAEKQADNAFGRLIAATTLRRLGEIDARLARHLDKPLPRKAHVVRNILRVAAAQLIFLDSAAHAAVNCAVEQAKAQPGRYDRLVNAVLRQEGRAPEPGEMPPDIDTPDWLWRSWCAAYGESGAAAIAHAHRGEAPLDLTLKDAATTAHWCGALGGTSLAPGHVRLSGAGDVTGLAGFDDGAWWVQDLAASLPARVLASVLGGLENRTVLDLCAAPGGKTAQLAAGGARVFAVDNDAQRLARLENNMARLGLHAECAASDGRTWTPPDGIALDAILVDAPCTATGTIRRHPDIPWLKRESDVAQAVTAQRALLENALAGVAPDGIVVYAVCSLQPEEGKAQINALVAEGRAVRVPIGEGEAEGIADPDADGDLRTLPSDRAGEGGMDGFFVARLRPSG